MNTIITMIAFWNFWNLMQWNDDILHFEMNNWTVNHMLNPYIRALRTIFGGSIDSLYSVTGDWVTQKRIFGCPESGEKWIWTSLFFIFSKSAHSHQTCQKCGKKWRKAFVQLAFNPFISWLQVPENPILRTWSDL